MLVVCLEDRYTSKQTTLSLTSPSICSFFFSLSFSLSLSLSRSVFLPHSLSLSLSLSLPLSLTLSPQSLSFLLKPY